MFSEELGNTLKNYSGLKAALLVAGVSTGMPGGAERLYSGLYGGLSALGLDVALISIPADEPSFDSIMHNYQFCESLDLRSFDVVVSTKAPTYMVNHPCHVMYLVHTVRVYDDMFERNFPSPSQEIYRQRSKLHTLDVDAMTSIAARFAIGNEVARRLYRTRGFDAEVLHPPLGIDGFAPGPQGDYFFLPGRLHPWKRVDLVIESVKRSSLPMRLVLVGTGEDEERLRQLAGNDPRIEFMGKVNDEKLLDLYSNCLAVPFVPVHEDYGYITLEAFASHKPVITCSDSGEPTHFVKNRQNGLICPPDPENLRQALEWIFNNRAETLEMGKRGAAGIKGMSWQKTASRLIEAALGGSRHSEQAIHITKPPKVRVAVLDMQPIAPPVGGGRLRLLGLYHNLGKNFKTSYIGTYDWPGEQYRRHFLSDSLEETDIPLSKEHHDAAKALSEKAGGRTVIDISFGKLGHLSPEYVEQAKRVVRESDIVVFSHPWVYPLVAEDLAPTQFVVYDSQNVEGFLRAQLLDRTKPEENELLRYVVEVEKNLGERADLIFTCSHEDLLRFNRIYDFPFDKMRILPNGSMAFSESIMKRPEKNTARRALGIPEDQFIAIFIGSAYTPNVESAQFIIQHLAPALPEIVFVIAGGVGDCISPVANNVIITGFIDEKTKRNWLCAADIAVNPMFSGSGTNIKMFEFMAFSLPTVTTLVGARGIDTGGRAAFLEVRSDADAFVRAICSLINDELRIFMGEEARLCIEEAYAWERISLHAGELLLSRHTRSGQPRPFFSVIVSSFERHDQLDTLMERLCSQVERDFEIVIVDPNSIKWPNSEKTFGVPMVYVRSFSAGAARCRNYGASIAQGQIFCFINTEYFPEDEWLLHMRKLFQDDLVCVAEGQSKNDISAAISWSPLMEEILNNARELESNIAIRSGFFQKIGGFNLLSKAANASTNSSQRSITFKRISSTPPPTLKIGWISTWNTKCGIAAYSKYLISGIHQEIAIFADHTEEMVSADEHYVKRCWQMDCDNFEELESALREAECNIVVMQFHYGFFDFAKYSSFLNDQIENGRKIVVMMHCTTDPVNLPGKRLGILADSLKKCNKILVHSKGDLERLKIYGLKNICLFPQGVCDYFPEKRLLNNGSALVIASYGYFREHKGLIELLNALKNLINKLDAPIKLRMLNAEYPAPDSRKAIAEARLMIKKFKLEDFVELTTEYLSDQESIDILADADLIVFPYQNTIESSSAAVRHGLASGRPVAVTPLEIFDDLAPCTFKLPGITPQEIATGIESIIREIKEKTPNAVNTLQAAATWRKNHRFSLLSKKLYKIISE